MDSIPHLRLVFCGQYSAPADSILRTVFLPVDSILRILLRTGVSASGEKSALACAGSWPASAERYSSLRFACSVAHSAPVRGVMRGRERGSGAHLQHVRRASQRD